MERKGLSKRTRFEVFKRDNFTCQYCGRSVPAVILEVDHIVAVADGGSDDIVNLITSCFECNRGKSDRPLTNRLSRSDVGADLEILKEQEAQLKEYFKYQQKIEKLRRQWVEMVNEKWGELSNGYWHLSDRGKSQIYPMVKKYKIDSILEALVIAHHKFGNSPNRVIPYMYGILRNWENNGKA